MSPHIRSTANDSNSESTTTEPDLLVRVPGSLVTHPQGKIPAAANLFATALADTLVTYQGIVEEAPQRLDD